MEPSGLRSLATLVVAVLALGLGAAGPASAAQDPLLSDQWVFGSADAIGAREAWARSAGGGVLVAVIDSGLQLDHPDLKANLWTNPGEVANGVDDDGNGFVDDVHGANMFDSNADLTDNTGHGTHIAGIIAAQAGNGVGGSGLAPQARIMTVKVHGPTNKPDHASLVRGIRYAVDQGARILNISLNSELASVGLTDAVRYANEQGATVVASAGNNARDLDAQPSYPAALPDAAVLSVTASTRKGGLTSIANRGAGSVDLAAPGSMIASTARGSAYEFRSGTSMATPFVAGALALLAAARPDLSQPQLREALLASAKRTSALAGKVAGGGLDVGVAMHRLVPGTWGRSAAASRARLRLRVAARARAGRRATIRWSATNASSVTRWTVALDGRRVRTVSKRQTRSASARVSRPGRHRWTITGYDSRSGKVVSATRSFRVVR